MAGAETGHGIVNAIERLQAKAPAERRRCTRQARDARRPRSRLVGAGWI
jgi:hypothetical protein